jgi:hypothetical protein
MYLSQIVTLKFATVVGPVEEGLTLAWSTSEITPPTVVGYLSDMTTDGLPSLDLAFVLTGNPPTQIVAAIPLKPPPWIIRVYPAFPLPHREWL